VVAFAPDSKLLAVGHTMSEVRLFRSDTFEEVATLTSPEPLLTLWFAFNPDSSRLAVAAGKTIQLWDLRAVRERLRELGLDWDLPPYPSPAKQPVTPLRIEIVNGP
jgi:WD40 repeat protein